MWGKQILSPILPATVIQNQQKTIKKEEFSSIWKKCTGNIHNRYFAHPRGTAPCSTAYTQGFCTNHPEDALTDMIHQYTGALGDFPRAEPLENVNVSLLPSFLKVIESGSHCPLLIFEGEKKAIMAEICDNFPTAQHSCLPSDQHFIFQANITYETTEL